MFNPSDNVTEIIAHFLGYFEIRVEELRIRLDYEEFVREASLPPEDLPLLNIPVDAVQQYAFSNFTPGVSYEPPAWTTEGEAPIQQTSAGVALPAAAASHWMPSQSAAPSEFSASAPDLAPTLVGPQPDSVIAVFNQKIGLLDNDVVILGDDAGSVTFHSGAVEGLALLSASANAVSAPVTNLPMVDSLEDVPVFMARAGDYIDGLEQGGGGQASVIATDTLAGTYVNGVAVEETPDVIEALPGQLRAEIEGENEAGEPAVQNGADVPESVALEAGANMLVNEAAYLNAGVTTVGLGVLGNYHQLDAIIQTNALSDIDRMGAGVEPAGPASSMFNVAAFEQQTADTAGEARAQNPGEFPSFWQVSVVEGDIVFLEWMQQFTFMSDEDIHVLSATGTKTTVTTGENVGLNGVSFAHIGQSYDLMIVGGNLYDANIIVQTNVLYDDDVLEVLEGGQGYGAATGGNLLWNQATIHNVGAGEVTAGRVPDHYQQAAERLSSGSKDMPDGFGHDGDFEGFGALRVLFVSGDVYDLRYVEQTNVLGDADYVAAAKSKLLAGNEAVSYEVSTGSNALVNMATIIDYDTIGDTAYVGGEVYSDAILIQADMVAANGPNGTGDALVNEVVAFLETDTPIPLNDDFGADALAADGPPADIMQSVLT